MNLEYVEGIKIVLLLWIIGLLSQILRYMKLIWDQLFEMSNKLSDVHKVIVPSK